MLNIQEVLKAWITAANPSEEQLNLAKERLNVCVDCEERGELPLLTNYAYCKLCLCPLDKKVFSNKNSCPLKQWKT